MPAGGQESGYLNRSSIDYLVILPKLFAPRGPSARRHERMNNVNWFDPVRISPLFVIGKSIVRRSALLGDNMKMIKLVQIRILCVCL